MPALAYEVAEAITELSIQLKNARETVDAFLLAMTELEHGLDTFKALIDKPNVEEEILIFLRDVSMTAISYEGRFLNNYQRLVRKAMEYIHSLPKKQRLQKDFKFFFAELGMKQARIAQYKEKLHEFAGNCLKVFRTTKGQVLTKEEILERLDAAITILTPFANAAPAEVYKQLEEMGDVVIKVRVLMRR